jgi:hypothetical protein
MTRNNKPFFDFRDRRLSQPMRGTTPFMAWHSITCRSRPRAAVLTGNRRRFFQSTAILEICRDAGRPEGVIADKRLNAGRLRAAANHLVSIALGQAWIAEDGVMGLFKTNKPIGRATRFQVDDYITAA